MPYWFSYSVLRPTSVHMCWKAPVIPSGNLLRAPLKVYLHGICREADGAVILHTIQTSTDRNDIEKASSVPDRRHVQHSSLLRCHNHGSPFRLHQPLFIRAECDSPATTSRNRTVAAEQVEFQVSIVDIHTYAASHLAASSTM
jgi:hypothetical protein